MFAKLKFLGWLGVALTFISVLGSLAYNSWQLHKATQRLDDARVEVSKEGAGEKALNELTKRVDKNEVQTQTSLDNIEKLKEEALAIERPPIIQEVIKETRVETIREKEVKNEPEKHQQPAAARIALRAFDELWRDFCERFPSERDCRERAVPPKGQVQTYPPARS